MFSSRLYVGFSSSRRKHHYTSSPKERAHNIDLYGCPRSILQVCTSFHLFISLFSSLPRKANLYTLTHTDSSIDTLSSGFSQLCGRSNRPNLNMDNIQVSALYYSHYTLQRPHFNTKNSYSVEWCMVFSLCCYLSWWLLVTLLTMVLM